MPAARTYVARIVVGAAMLCALPAHAAGLVNINTADAAALDALPGIGPTKAAAIVAYRSAHGPFAAPADLEQVSGIGPATYAKLAPLITVGSVAPAPAAVQPVAAAARSQEVQAVERPAGRDETSPALTSLTDEYHATSTSAAGMTPGPEARVPAAAPLAGAGLLHSPWTVGFLVVLACAGGALLVL